MEAEGWNEAKIHADKPYSDRLASFLRPLRCADRHNRLTVGPLQALTRSVIRGMTVRRHD